MAGLDRAWGEDGEGPFDEFGGWCVYNNGKARIRNQVAAISNHINDPCAIKVKSTEFNFKMAISGLANPVMAMASGDLEVDGSNTEFLQFLTYFR